MQTLYEEARRRRAEGNTTGAFARYRRILEAAVGAERAAVLAELGEMYREACDVLEARRWHAEALAACRAQGDVGGAVESLRRLAQVEELGGDLAAAAARLREALAELGAADDLSAARLRAAHGSVTLRRGEEAAGLAEMLAAWRILRSAAPTDAAAVLADCREHQERLGRARFRMLLRGAGATPDEMALLSPLP
jgi:hypothetical protein